MKDIPDLRDKQIEQLSFYMGHPKCLDLSDPGTGKTPPCCVYAFWVWDAKLKKTLWTMPKSLLKKNKAELIRFTEFEDGDVAILRTDRANMTKNWTGPTVSSFRTKRGFKVIVDEQETTTIALRDRLGPTAFYYAEVLHTPAGPAMQWRFLNPGAKPLTDYEHAPAGLRVTPVMGPDGQPQKVSVQTPEIFKDLIGEAVQGGAKVFICTFAFAAAHQERLLAAAPEIDLLLVDELHMPGGYSTPTTQVTESFFAINRHVSRFVGMTGTLINGRLDSAFAAIHAIEPRYYGSLQGFMFEHAAVMDEYGRVVVWKNEGKLRKIIEKHSIRRTFEEVYGKEDVVFFAEYAEMGLQVREKYQEFHDTALLELQDGKVIEGTSPGVALIRARQIMSHPETMLGPQNELTGKDQRVEIHLLEGKKTLLFASLVPEQDRLLKLARGMGLRAELINGKVTGKNRERINELAESGQLDVIVASGPTAAVGYNWEMFDLVIFVSIDFLDVNILQAYRRASRGTRTLQLRVIMLRYENSVDDRMYEIVKAKSELANRVDPTRPVLEFTEKSLS